MVISVPPEYFIYDNRLATFTQPQAIVAARARRASSAKGNSRAPKTLSWPHETIDPADMARAGFFFMPSPKDPDNAVCFLCKKSLADWEPNDNPLEEHLKHNPECGWAITAAVEANLGEYAEEDPRDPVLMEARKATFANRWPHEGKEGWNCKTNQMVEAGWRYAPLVDADDNVICPYCDCGLYGWEQEDEPWDEHFRRKERPNEAPCPFFSLISSRPAPKKAGRAARSSKASRLSLQSVSLMDISSMADAAAADTDDSIMTSASNTPSIAKASGKSAKAKRPAASRAKKTRAKNSEATEVVEDEPVQSIEQEPEPPAPLPAPEVEGRGRKRSTDEVEDSAATDAEAPAPKKRATRTRKARASDITEVSHTDTDMTDEPKPTKKATARKSTRKASGTRKTAARNTRKGSVTTTASTASPPPQIPDDEEIDRRLQADLDRPLTDDEDGPADADPDIKKAAAAAAASKKQNAEEQADNAGDLLQNTSTNDFATTNPAPAEATIPEDKALQDEMDIDEKEPDQDPEPDMLEEPEAPKEPEIPKGQKKGRKAATTKRAKQAIVPQTEETTEATSTDQPAHPPHLRATAEDDEPDEIAEAQVSLVSTSAVRRSVESASLKSVAAPSKPKAAAKRGRPAKKKNSQESATDSANVSTTTDLSTVSKTEAARKDDNEPAIATSEAPQKRSSTGKRGRPPKKIQAPDTSTLEPTQAALPPLPPTESHPEALQEETTTKEVPAKQDVPVAGGSPDISRKPVSVPKDSLIVKQRRVLKPVSLLERRVLSTLPQPPGYNTSPAWHHSAKQAASASPSPSAQSSDAENRPPSSNPSHTNSGKGKRSSAESRTITTPTRQRSLSPSKRQQQQQQENLIGGLQSTEEWTAVDLELVFENQQGDTGAGSDNAATRFFANGGSLSERERNMTVEEWIYYNAGQAEQKLKDECEAMVTAFEREGTRAMNVLEGLIVE